MEAIAYGVIVTIAVGILSYIPFRKKKQNETILDRIRKKGYER